MKRNLKEKAIRVRRHEILGDEGLSAIKWDKPLTTKLALQIINQAKLSHWSALYDYWFEETEEEGNYDQVTWNDIEEHDAGWLWYSAMEKNKANKGTHKEYHKLVQKAIAGQIEGRLLNMVRPQRLPTRYRSIYQWRKIENKKKYRVVKYIGRNEKGLPTPHYFVYRTSPNDITYDFLIVI